MLFNRHVLPSRTYRIPIICVGNLAVGGTGKTPHTEYLVRLLRQRCHVAVLSRGYKRLTKGYLLATADSTAADIGDEPYQMKNKFHDICVAVDENRCHGVEELLNLKQPPVDVILLDDAFQHRYVKAGLNILLTDYNRMFCDDKMLPAGLLREPKKGMERAQIIVVTKCPDNLMPIDFNLMRKRLGLFAYQNLFFTKIEYGDLYKLFNEDEEEVGTRARLSQQLQLFDKDNRPKTIPLRCLKCNTDVLILTGIANSGPLIGKLKEHVHEDYLRVISLPDHHEFTEQDIDLVNRNFMDDVSSENSIIVTTEKDAARWRLRTDLTEKFKDCLYVLPIKIAFLQNNKESFNQIILDYVGKNKRNSVVSQK